MPGSGALLLTSQPTLAQDATFEPEAERLVTVAEALDRIYLAPRSAHRVDIEQPDT